MEYPPLSGSVMFGAMMKKVNVVRPAAAAACMENLEWRHIHSETVALNVAAVLSSVQIL